MCSLKLPFPSFSFGHLVCGTAFPPWQRLRALVAAWTGAQNKREWAEQQWEWGGRLKAPVNPPSNTSTAQGRIEKHSNKPDNCFVSCLAACRYSSPLGRGWLFCSVLSLLGSFPQSLPTMGVSSSGQCLAQESKDHFYSPVPVILSHACTAVADTGCWYRSFNYCHCSNSSVL